MAGRTTPSSSMKASAGDTEALTEVPTSLKKLVRVIAHSFYGVEHFLLMDMLIRNPCMREEDLLSVLKFDKKMLRVTVNALRNEHFLKARLKVETDDEGKTTKHHYYFINYTGLVNVVKFKLHHIHQKLAAQERDSTSRVSFKCPGCSKGYTDMEADRLCDPETGTFVCMFCKTDLEEEQSEAPVQDARAHIAKFNEQIEPIYELLRECEDFKLSRDILEPEPTDVTHLTEEKRYVNKGRPELGEKSIWSGDATKSRTGFGYSQGSVTINVGDAADAAVAAGLKKEVKEQPVWMNESTVGGAPHKKPPVAPPPVSTSYFPSSGGSAVPPPVAGVVPTRHPPATGVTVSSTPEGAPDRMNTAIMQTLLIHEKKGPAATSGAKGSATSSTAAGGAGGGKGEESPSDDSDIDDEPPSHLKGMADRMGYGADTPEPTAAVDEMESGEEEEAMVSVGGKKVSYDDVTAELVNAMTPEEKRAYVLLGNQLYNDYE